MTIRAAAPAAALCICIAAAHAQQKTVYLFNPWPENAPMARLGNAAQYANMTMSPDKARCGWYSARFTATPYTVLFKNIFGNETYGQGGLGSAQAINLAAAFTAR